MTQPEHFDFLVVGAGLSGVAAGYHFQKAFPKKKYAILEGRESIGGTWDLFRYPGIRSDSDMFTFAYSFRPWKGRKIFGEGAEILSYLKDTARENGIDQKIRTGQRVERAAWSSKTSRWTLDIRDVKTDEIVQLTTKFLFLATGYYDYDEGYSPTFPGTERFGKDRIIHPQKWNDQVDFTGKRVVVIGSGATAVTLVPALATAAARVTMLQRSPTYILSLPSVDPTADWLRRHAPEMFAHGVTRWKNVALSTAFFQYCRRFPTHAKETLIGNIRRRFGKNVDVAPHFTPSYQPWDQRVCIVPNSDLFKTIRSGKAEVVTDQIETFTENGILLKSGRQLEADLIVTATGLKVSFAGGMRVFVDGEPLVPKEELNYKGALLTNTPNAAMAIGYTNASWMLKAELVCRYIVRLIAHMDAKGYDVVTPRAKHRDAADEVPLIDLKSGYVERAVDLIPKQGQKTPWRLHQNYFLDVLGLRFGKIDDGCLEFRKAGSLRDAGRTGPKTNGTARLAHDARN